MVSVNVSYPDFTNGEVSPRIAGRYDLQAFYKGGSRVENFVSEVTGNASFRCGSIYVGETATSGKALLYTFEFSDSISYILEFSAGKIRFYRDNGLIESGGSPYEVVTPYTVNDLFNLKFSQNELSLYITHPDYPPKVLTYSSSTSWSFATHVAYERDGSSQEITGITQANPAVVSYSGSDNFSNGDKVFLSGIIGMSQLNDQVYTVANVNTSSNTFELSGVDSSSYTAWSSEGVIYLLKAADFTTSGYPAAVTFYEDRLVYGGFSDSPQTLYFSNAALPNIFIVGTEVDDAIEYTVSGNGNNILWIKGTPNFLAIGTYGDVLQATGGLDGVITPESISVRPSNGYGVADINPVSRGAQAFYLQRNSLILRSFEYDYTVDSYIPVDRNTVADHITNSGITQIAFQEGRPNILWAVKTNGELIGMTLEEQEGISGWHRHITDGNIISVASISRSNEYNQLWLCVERDGSYFIEYLSDPVKFDRRDDFFTGDKSVDDLIYSNLTYEKQKQYIHLDSSLSYYGDAFGESAGAALTTAATSGSGVTFTASASVFSSDMVGRELWKKHINGTESGRATITAYISTTEVTCDITVDFDSTDSMAAGDWYLTASSFSGVDHLEGREVSVVADGGQHASITINSGVATLTTQASVVHVGLPYTGWLSTNDLEGGSQNGTSQTKRKSVTAIAVRLLDSLFCKVGVDYYSLEQINMRKSTMFMDRPPLIFNGDKKVICTRKLNDSEDAGLSRQKRAIICQDQPYPCNVQLIVPYMSVS